MGTYRDSLIAAMVVFLVINTLAISARLYVRIKLLTRAIGLDDLMLCLVFVSVSLALPPFDYPRGSLAGRRAMVGIDFADIKSAEWVCHSLRLGVRIYVLGIRGP